MIGARVAVGEQYSLVFLIFGEVPEQRFALLRFEPDCCLLGIGCSQIVGERLEQGSARFAIERGLLLCGFFVGFGG